MNLFKGLFQGNGRKESSLDLESGDHTCLAMGDPENVYQIPAKAPSRQPEQWQAYQPNPLQGQARSSAPQTAIHIHQAAPEPTHQFIPTYTQRHPPARPSLQQLNFQQPQLPPVPVHHLRPPAPTTQESQASGSVASNPSTAAATTVHENPDTHPDSYQGPPYWGEQHVASPVPQPQQRWPPYAAAQGAGHATYIHMSPQQQQQPLPQYHHPPPVVRVQHHAAQQPQHGQHAVSFQPAVPYVLQPAAAQPVMAFPPPPPAAPARPPVVVARLAPQPVVAQARVLAAAAPQPAQAAAPRPPPPAAQPPQAHYQQQTQQQPQQQQNIHQQNAQAPAPAPADDPDSPIPRESESGKKGTHRFLLFLKDILGLKKAAPEMPTREPRRRGKANAAVLPLGVEPVPYVQPQAPPLQPQQPAAPAAAAAAAAAEDEVTSLCHDDEQEEARDKVGKLRGSVMSQSCSAVHRLRVTLERDFDSWTPPLDNLLIPLRDLTLRSEIGSGGFGTVHLAEWEYERGHRKSCAVKLASFRTSDDSVFRQFMREIEVMCQVPRHKYIVKLEGYCKEIPTKKEEKRQLAIVTEYCSRGSLFDRLHNPHVAAMTYQAMLDMLRKIAEGMAHLHRNDIMHRDLKSANILIDEFGTPKICDFGLARSSSAYMTRGLGTYQWMAPEVMFSHTYTNKADVWSFGIIVWECVTRCLPFHGREGIQVAMAVVYKHERPPIPAGTPPDLVKLMRMCWEQAPHHRPDFTRIADMLNTMLNTWTRTLLYSEPRRVKTEELFPPQESSNSQQDAARGMAAPAPGRAQPPAAPAGARHAGPAAAAAVAAAAMPAGVNYKAAPPVVAGTVVPATPDMAARVALQGLMSPDQSPATATPRSNATGASQDSPSDRPLYMPNWGADRPRRSAGQLLQAGLGGGAPAVAVVGARRAQDVSKSLHFQAGGIGIGPQLHTVHPNRDGARRYVN